MRWLLLFLLLLPSLSAAAPAPGLVRCEGRVDGGAASLRVVGYGPDSAGAKARALQLGRVAAEQALGTDLWPWLLSDEMVAKRDSEPRLRGVLQDNALGVPGFKWKEGRCEGVKLPAGGKAGWAATVGEATVVRGLPDVAASAAQRHGCLRSWEAGLSRALLDVVASDSSESGAVLHKALQGQLAALQTCLLEAPVLAAATGSRSRGGKAKGLVQCTRHPLVPGGESGIGWGMELERAAEEAAWDAVATEARAALAAGLAAAAGSRDRRTMDVNRGLNRLRALVPSDAVELAVTSCASVREDAPLTWKPSDAGIRADCAQDWSAMVVTPAASDLPADARDGLCRARIRDGASQMRAALSSGGSDADRFRGWERTLRCDAACRGQTSMAAEAAVALPGVPDRSQQKKALALAKKAAKKRDLVALALVLPALDEPRVARAVERAGDAFWTRLDAALKAADLGDYQWRELGGIHVLQPQD